jgi:hypothetical protein
LLAQAAAGLTSGMQIVAVNGVPTTAMAHEQLVSVFGQAGQEVTITVVAGAPIDLLNDQPRLVELERGALGFGMHVVHEPGVPYCRVDLVKPDGVAGKSGLVRVGDTVVEVNGENQRNSTDESLQKTFGGASTIKLTLLAEGVVPDERSLIQATAPRSKVFHTSGIEGTLGFSLTDPEEGGEYARVRTVEAGQAADSSGVSVPMRLSNFRAVGSFAAVWLASTFLARLSNFRAVGSFAPVWLASTFLARLSNFRAVGSFAPVWLASTFLARLSNFRAVGSFAPVWLASTFLARLSNFRAVGSFAAVWLTSTFLAFESIALPMIDHCPCSPVFQ